MSANRPAIPIGIRRQVLFEARHHCAVCCSGLPLEQAHVIQWSKSREHSVANLVALCANCHSRADSEKWGAPVLRKYKKTPCILARRSNSPEGTNAHLVEFIEVLVKKTITEMQRRSPEFASSLAAFVGSPGSVQVFSVEKANSSKIVLKLTKEAADKILEGFQSKDPLLAAYLDDFELLGVRVQNQLDKPATELKQPSALLKEEVIVNEFSQKIPTNTKWQDRTSVFQSQGIGMIADYLDRNYVLSEIRTHRDYLAAQRKKALEKDKATLKAIEKNKITIAQITRAIAALDDTLEIAKKDKTHPQGSAYLPSDPVISGLQAALTRSAIDHWQVQVNAPAAKAFAQRGANKMRGADTVDTSPLLRLRRRDGPFRHGFVEGEDPLDGLDDFVAKFGALFSGRRHFNRNPARPAVSTKPLTLFVFGDWGTGLNLAGQVAQRIREQLAAGDSWRQYHVIHLGDIYYAGDAEEYKARAFPFWPVTSTQSDSIGSWSLNGCHDMYTGGFGYFDTLLRKDYMLRWHGDAAGEPSSFLLIEDNNWQIFGLDTSWNMPSIGSTVFGKPSLNDYGGRNGVLTREQVEWMAKMRNPAKGCILLTHHQPASSRSNEQQHSDQAVAMLKKAGIYAGIDAWFWGHEHRCVVFKPKTDRTDKRLMDAPGFCACLGHGGVPVTKEAFAAANRIADVLWEEDRLGDDAPIYEGQRVVPFGFARIDTKPESFEFRVFDHDGKARFMCAVTRDMTPSPTKTDPRSDRFRARAAESKE